MDLPIDAELIRYAIEQENELYAWELWTSLYPYMQMKWFDFIKFDDFKGLALGQKHRYTIKSKEEIIEEIETIVALHEGR